ncbi:MAG: hypothetical protein HY775_08165 [Acidobacteria bacterium]|nr:hypothetical protein [Acidobacteriota bacterium]
MREALTIPYLRAARWTIHRLPDGLDGRRLEDDVPRGAFALFPFLLNAGDWRRVEPPEGGVGVSLAPNEELHLSLQGGDASALDALDIGDSRLRGLDAKGCGLCDQDLERLSRFSGLKLLGLAGNAIGGPGLRHLSAMRDLEILMVQGNPLTTLAGLGDLPSLRVLWASGRSLGSDGLRELWRLQGLTSLVIQHSLLDDDAAPHIGRLIALRELNLAHAPLGDGGLAALADLSELRVLSLAGTKVTGEGLRRRAGSWMSLQVLNLASVDVGSEVEDLVEGLPRLHTLDVHATRVPDEVRLRLRRRGLIVDGVSDAAGAGAREG